MTPRKNLFHKRIIIYKKRRVIIVYDLLSFNLVMILLFENQISNDNIITEKISFYVFLKHENRPAVSRRFTIIVMSTPLLL